MRAFGLGGGLGAVVWAVVWAVVAWRSFDGARSAVEAWQLQLGTSGLAEAALTRMRFALPSGGKKERRPTLGRTPSWFIHRDGEPSATSRPSMKCIVPLWLRGPHSKARTWRARNTVNAGRGAGAPS